MNTEPSRSGGKNKIPVGETQELGLIILRPSGVVYTNQTGGVCCVPVEAEGTYVKLHDDAGPLGRLFKTWGNGSLSLEEPEWAVQINGVLVQMGFRGLRVNQQRLQESREAWVFVQIDRTMFQLPAGVEPQLLAGHDPVGGILTWQNSD